MRVPGMVRLFFSRRGVLLWLLLLAVCAGLVTAWVIDDADAVLRVVTPLTAGATALALGGRDARRQSEDDEDDQPPPS
jgi:hypothetical protein